jgi:hypothetical protein
LRTATATAPVRPKYQIPSLFVALALMAFGGGNERGHELLLPLARLIGVAGCRRISSPAQGDRGTSTVSVTEGGLLVVPACQPAQLIVR